MRGALFFATAVLLTSVNATAQPKQTSPSDGLSCFVNLSTPEYPKAALDQHIDGSVWTWTQVNAQGAVEKIDTQVVSPWTEASKMLVDPVEKAIRAAHIEPQCAGKTVWVVFRYDFYGEATPAPKITAEKTSDNLMQIESEPNSAR